jgi:hypothetical protein
MIKNVYCSKQLVTFGEITSRSLVGEHHSFGTTHSLHLQGTLNVKVCLNRRASPKSYTLFTRKSTKIGHEDDLKGRRHTCARAHTHTQSMRMP